MPNFKISIFTQILILALLANCSPSYNLFSLEKTYDSCHMAVEKKDIDGMSLCFDFEGGTYTEEGVLVLADRLFYKTEIESHRIISKEITSDTEITLLVEDNYT